MAFGDAPFDDGDSPPLSLLEPYAVREDGTLVSLARPREKVMGNYQNDFCALLAELMAAREPLTFIDGYAQSSQRYSFAKLAAAAARDEAKRCEADRIGDRLLAIVRPEKQGEVDGIIGDVLRLAEVADEPGEGDD